VSAHFGDFMMLNKSLPICGSEDSHMAEHFYGYGRWDAPFWFIGPEPGDDSVAQRYESLKALESEPVADCAAVKRRLRSGLRHRIHI
jgi:hypothetical protein